MNEYNIVIASVGGQGGLTLSRIIGQAALLKGYHVRIGETLGMSQRGGIVQSYVRIGDTVESPIVGEGEANAILGLEPVEALRAARRYANNNTLIIVNTEPIHTITTIAGREKYPPLLDILDELRTISQNMIAINATEYAKNKGLPYSTNVVVLAVFASKTNIMEPEYYIKGIKTFVRRLTKENIELFNDVLRNVNKIMTMFSQ